MTCGAVHCATTHRPIFITARRHDSAMLAVALRPSVCLSVTSQWLIETSYRIDVEAFSGLSYTP